MSDAKDPRGRGRLLSAVRARLRHRAADDGADPIAEPEAAERPPKPARPAPPDPMLEQLAAEARYHRDRYELYRARVVSGSSSATSLGRLRELERSATAAADRLAHARRTS